MRLVRIITLLLCVLMAHVAMRAQQRILPPADTTDTSLSVSLLTCAPGSEIYELEGHSGLRLQYAGVDVVANWGLFDFNSPGFVYRFVKGETDYCVGLIPTRAFVTAYADDGRRVTEQTLNLTPRQAAEVVELVNDNLQPANRVYRYNYVLDNCATRPLCIVERAIGDSINIPCGLAEFDASTTFRNVMQHFHAGYPWYQFGIDLALGSGIDYPIDTRSTAFAPEVLRQLAATATIGHGIDTRPLVTSTAILADGPAQGTILPHTPWWRTPMAVALVVLAVSLLLTWRDMRHRRTSQWWDFTLFLVYGIEGCVIAFLVFVSTHEASSPNYLILWLNPLCLIVPALVWLRRCRKALAVYHGFNLAAIATYAICIMAGMQYINPAFLPLILSGALRSFSYIYIYREPKGPKQQ